MTAGTDGTPQPENDDPFAHLYRGQGDPSGAPTARPGVPRTSYHQVSRVGERRQAPTQPGGQGYPPPQQQAGRPQHGWQPPAAGQPQQGAVPPARGGRGRARSGPGGLNQGGLMIGAVAVVAVVVVGITFAVMSNGSSGKGQSAAGPSDAPSAAASTEPSSLPSSDPMQNLPQNFAANLVLAGGAKTNTNHAGSQNAGGVFVDGMNAPGATATWNLTVPQKGSYTLWVRYANADNNTATATVLDNGTPLGWKLNLKDYGSGGNWDRWFTSYVTVNLNQGANSIALTCAAGDVCNFNLDRVGLVPDTGGTPPRPKGWTS